ncbi:MAG: alpha/beta hydrolase [Oceanospirillaceae bacterium]|nr:alpha/beta hydrolase [Oceanospirillaceae bacterium]
MRIDPNELRQRLPQNNLSASLDAIWLNYFDLYGLGELVAKYHINIDMHTRDKQYTVYQHYRQKKTSIGTCIIVHGYMDHTGLYRHLIADRLAAGWDVLIYDKTGHGLSSGECYAIDSFSQYAEQLQLVLEYLAKCCDKQWLLIGQSTGASVVLEHALNPVFKPFKQISQRVLLAPLVRSSHFFAVKIQYQLLRFLVKRVKRGKSANSHDADYLNFIQQVDPLTRRWIKVNWVGAMLSWEKRFIGYPASDLALRVIQGDGDETVDWQHNLKVIERKFPGVNTQIIKDAKHHLVNEGKLWRMQVFKLLP